MIRDHETGAIRFAFSNIIDAYANVIANMQVNHYWIEGNFEDVKGLCDLDIFLRKKLEFMESSCCIGGNSICIPLVY